MVEKRKMISKIVEQLDKTIQLLTHIYIEFILTHYFTSERITSPETVLVVPVEESDTGSDVNVLPSDFFM